MGFFTFYVTFPGEVISPEQAQLAHNFLHSGDRRYIEKPLKPAPPPIVTKTKVRRLIGYFI